ncbi:FAD-dependent oxidoreductase [Microbacterium sp. A93]|uniref:FAD-dependent oxidoreductase n=1 Tax=Microbacterium sp. A93 TaxID=3450716 RepID=UPI003F429352
MPGHEVAIVGAGPVGLLLACLLAQAGVAVAVYEQRADADDRSRAIGIHPPGRAALDAVGLGGDVRRESLGLDGGEVLCGGRMLASVSFTAAQRVLILPQRRTHTLLRERLARLQPRALQVGHTVLGLRDEGDLVRLSLDGDGALGEATASIVVAADGVRSEIRGQLGIEWQERPGAGSYAMADVAVMADVVDEMLGRRVQLHCEPSGLVESFPLPQGRRRWVVADPYDRLQDATAFAHAIAERTGIHLDMSEASSPTPFRAQQHRAARLAVGRVALVGDAAHETSPIGGQGMNLGWMGARILASAIEVSLRAGTADFTDYERRMLCSAGRAQRRASFYMAMGSPAHGLTLSVRNALIRALGSPPLCRRAADLITMRGI